MTSYDYEAPQFEALGEEATWFEFCNGELLMIQRCAACSNYTFPPRSVCPHCLSHALEWVEAAGTGIVYTYTLQHRAPPGFDGQAPYIVAVVELDEGVRLMSRVPAAAEDFSIGTPVAVRWASLGGGRNVPVFVPSGEPGG